MLKIKRLAVAIGVLSTASFMLVGCGGTGQDDGEVTTDYRTISGRAIDGDIARAMVFEDTNNNGRRDAWEAFAFTDNNGYFSFSPVSDTDYCSPSATEEDLQYCLRITSDDEETIIRVDGGYDRLTNEPFIGQLSRRLTATAESPSAMVISPITTLLTDAGHADQRKRLLQSLQIDDVDLDQDYLNSDRLHSADARLLNLALKLHKTTTVIAESLGNTYEAIGSELNTPNDASAMVYRQLADELLRSGDLADDVLTNPERLRHVTQGAESDIHQLYIRYKLWAPFAAVNLDTVVQQAAVVPQVVDRLIDPAVVLYSQAEAKGRASALEVVVLKASHQGHSSAEFQRATDFFLSDEKAPLAEALVRDLSDARGDISQLVQEDFVGLTTAEAIAAVARLPADAVPFADLTGKSIRISDMDLGFAPFALDDSEVELYFLGDHGLTRGPLAACIKHIDDAHQDGTLGKGNTRGELVKGYWSLLGETQEGSSHNVLLTLNFLGTRYQAILKAAGREVVNGQNLHRVRFDQGGEITEWHSAEGVQILDHVPQSHQDCQERLSSRIGL